MCIIHTMTASKCYKANSNTYTENKLDKRKWTGKIIYEKMFENTR